MGRPILAHPKWVALLTALLPAWVNAGEPGLIRQSCACDYATLVARVHHAIEANQMKLVAEASPTKTAADQGFTIPGDTVAMVFRNDYARRIIAIVPESMIEPPIRLHVREQADGSATVEYYRPSDLFARYGAPALQPIAAELDQIFAKIVADATRP